MNHIAVENPGVITEGLPEPPLTPSRVRYGVLTFLCVLAFVFYVDRICISKAAPDIKRDLGLSDSNMSLVFAAFTIAYSLFEVTTGWLGDRYGSRGVMTRIVIWWSVFTALTGAAMGLVSLIAIRFLFGAGEAGAFPNTARILARWFPVEQRGFAQGMINSTALFGGAAAPVAAAYLIDLVGWRWAFVIFAIPGVVWALIFHRWFHDNPADHPAVNSAELKLIEQSAVKRTETTHPRIPWRLVLTSRNMWLLGFVLACSAFNSYMYFSWYPTYLESGRGVESKLSGWLSSLVLAGGALGSLAGGTLADFLLKQTGSKRWSRSGLGAIALSTAAIMLLLAVNTDSSTGSAIWTTMAVFAAFTTLASWWGAVTDISGPHLGALFGLMNSLGGLGAIASQLFVGYFADWMMGQGYSGRAQWDPIFYVYAGVLFAGAVGWLFIDASKPIAPLEPDVMIDTAAAAQ
jgi:MFS transporter, ACS family, glucarate transporter